MCIAWAPEVEHDDPRDQRDHRALTEREQPQLNTSRRIEPLITVPTTRPRSWSPASDEDIATSALEQVAERNQQRQPDHVARLGDRDQQARVAVRYREGTRDRVQERLRVVEVRDRGAAREREQQYQRPADPGAELGSLCDAIAHE